jgi:hypothetical protein
LHGAVRWSQRDQDSENISRPQRSTEDGSSAHSEAHKEARVTDPETQGQCSLSTAYLERLQLSIGVASCSPSRHGDKDPVCLENDQSHSNRRSQERSAAFNAHSRT